MKKILTILSILLITSCGEESECQVIDGEKRCIEKAPPIEIKPPPVMKKVRLPNRPSGTKIPNPFRRVYPGNG